MRVSDDTILSQPTLIVYDLCDEKMKDGHDICASIVNESPLHSVLQRVELKMRWSCKVYFYELFEMLHVQRSSSSCVDVLAQFLAHVLSSALGQRVFQLNHLVASNENCHKRKVG